jgi:hypothetical protein
MRLTHSRIDAITPMTPAFGANTAAVPDIPGTDQVAIDVTCLQRGADRRRPFVRRRGVPAFHEKKDFDLAISDYSEVIRLDDNNAAAWNKRGVAKQMKGNMTGGAADLARAQQLKQGNHRAFARVPGYRGQVYHWPWYDAQGVDQNAPER